MKINVTLPFDQIHQPDEFISQEAVIEIATVLDRTLFHAACDTDHPCPTGRWLDAGGHHAQDPFVILSIVAAVTKKLRVQTGILVLPYRNPFITARAVATLDVFSGGRVLLGVGAGYLKAEYKALGVDFDQRNELMDEYLRAMKAAWTQEEFTFEGSGYTALGNRILPLPVQKPHPPLLIGGNSKRAIRRAAELGDAWNPFLVGEQGSTTTRTAAMTGAEDLKEGVAYMHAHCEAIGRATPPGVVVGGLNKPGESITPAQLVDRIGEFARLGVTGAGLYFGGRTRAEWCDNAERMSAEVIAKLD